MVRHMCFVVAFFVTLLGACQQGLAQCAGWLPGDGVPGVNGPVYSIVEWDPDGEGPTTPRWVVGGTFTSAGRVNARNLAVFDPMTQTWSPLSTGVRDGVTVTAVYALCALPDGRLVAAGAFSRAGDVLASNIAAWDGSTWTPLGLGLNGFAFAIDMLSNGHLVVGGMFTAAGGQPANRVAVWDGQSWSGLGAGLGGLSVLDAVNWVAVTANDSIVASGNMAYRNGQPRSPVHLWNGAEWVGLGVHSDGFAKAVAVLPNDEIVTFLSRFGNSIGNNTVARWSGGAWVPLGAPFTDHVLSLDVAPNGDLLAGGALLPFGGIARWDGTRWSSLGLGADGTVRAVAPLANGGVVVGGLFQFAGSRSAAHTALWDGTAWRSLSSGTSTVKALATLPNGDVVAGGYFTQIQGVSANYVARWDGASWTPLGLGLDGPVHAMIALPDGNIVVGGEFTRAGNVAATRVARWSGTHWIQMGWLPNTVTRLLSLPDGPVLAIGTTFSGAAPYSSQLNVWDGRVWTNSIPAPEGRTSAIWLDADGRLVAGGRFLSSDGVYLGCVAVRTPTGWAYSGSELRVTSEVRDAIPRPEGGWWLAGSFSLPDGASHHIAWWDGQVVTLIGSPGVTTGNPAESLLLLPDGDLIAGGGFFAAGSLAPGKLIRWNGSSMSLFGGGADGTVHALAMHNGELLVGGAFSAIGDGISSSFARYSFTGIPVVASHPQPQTITDRDTPTLSATPASGYDNVSVQWFRNGVALVDGPGGASVGGGTVTGASATLATPTDGSAAVLTILNARLSDSGTFTATFTNLCGNVTTTAAVVRVAPCPADTDADGEVDGEDVSIFFAAWDAGHLFADITGDDSVDSDDVIAFFARWDTGC